MEIIVGCCGTSGLSIASYSAQFRALELQSTFYRLPRESTARRWREQAPNLIFTLKAFQGITHPADSPTWRRSGKALNGVEKSEVGLFALSKYTKAWWDETERIATILRADIVVLQLPPKFDYTEKNLSKMQRFFQSISLSATPAVEFRHASWYSKVKEVARLVEKWGGIVVTDPLKIAVPEQRMQYHRLHGMDGMVNYGHKYSDRELRLLKDRLKGETVFVFFNNVNMREDAKRFIAVLDSS